MAVRPDKKPRWATVPTVNPTTLKNNVIEPTEGKKDLGFDYLEKAARNTMNWILNKAYEWIDYFDKNTVLLVLENDPTPDLSFKLQGGTYFTQGTTLVTIADVTLGPLVAPTVNPRIDRVILNKLTGVISITTGVEAGSPVPVALLDNEIPLAQIAMVLAQTQVLNSAITDERPIWDTVLAASLLDAGVSELSTDAEAIAKADTARVITASNLGALDASTTFKGMSEASTDGETQTGTDPLRYVTPAGLATIAKYAAAATGFTKATNTFIRDNLLAADSFDVDAVIGSSFESVGPTGSGATNIWTALDNIPADATSIKIAIYTNITGSTTSTAYISFVYARKNGETDPIAIATRKSATLEYNQSGSIEGDSNMCESTIPIDSDGIFDLAFVVVGVSPTTTVSMQLIEFSI